jgi:hypothetical protein
VTLATGGRPVGADVGYMGQLELSEGLARAGVAVVDAPPPGVPLIAAPVGEPDTRLAEALHGSCTPMHRIGDCAGGTRILHAVRDGLRVGMELP